MYISNSVAIDNRFIVDWFRFLMARYSKALFRNYSHWTVSKVVAVIHEHSFSLQVFQSIVGTSMKFSFA